MLIAYEKGARLIVSVGSQFNLVESSTRNRRGMSSTFSRVCASATASSTPRA